MSQRKNRSRRGVENLVESAHAVVHLLLNLQRAISHPGVAAECGCAAERLGDAIRRVARQHERER